jgi:threonine aldolase
VIKKGRVWRETFAVRHHSLLPIHLIISTGTGKIADTVTAPSPEMLAYALKAASFGDDVFGWDYCTNRLEEHVAKLCGKEAAIFVSSGTMGNQISMRCLLDKPPYRYVNSLALISGLTSLTYYSVLSDYRSHIYTSEAGGLASNSGATCIPVVPSNGE